MRRREWNVLGWIVCVLCLATCSFLVACQEESDLGSTTVTTQVGPTQSGTTLPDLPESTLDQGGIE